MNKLIFLVLAIVLIGFGFWYFNLQGGQAPAVQLPSVITNQNNVSPTTNTEGVKTIATNLDTPWGIAFLPDNSILITERKGSVRLITKEGVLTPSPIATIKSVREVGEGGLLGVTAHPDFNNNNFIYFYYTYSETGGNTLNRVVRMTYKNNELANEEIIVDKIPGAANHDGGRIKFGPDKLLYIGTGDAQEPSRSQDTSSLAGKILRVNQEGRVEVYSYGHRNVQGLTWDGNGTMYSSEHGRSGVQSGFDELNLVQQGSNYGWPDSEGDKILPNTVGPIKHSGATNTWAPSGMAYLNGSIFFGGLRGQALYEAILESGRVTQVKEHFKGQYGRIRDVVVGLDNMLYFTTSNRDGRGNPANEDDRIIRVNPKELAN